MRNCQHCRGAIPPNSRPHRKYCSPKCRHDANNQNNLWRKREYNARSAANQKASRLALKQAQLAREYDTQQRQAATLESVRAVGAVAAQYQYRVSPALGAEYNLP